MDKIKKWIFHIIYRAWSRVYFMRRYGVVFSSSIESIIRFYDQIDGNFDSYRLGPSIYDVSEHCHEYTENSWSLSNTSVIRWQWMWLISFFNGKFKRPNAVIVIFLSSFLTAENDQIRSIYWEAEQKHQKYAKILVITFVVYDQSMYVLSFISTILSILIGNTDASTWPLVYDMSVPFDAKTIAGWYAEFFLTACMDLSYLTCMLLGTNQFIGYCIYIETICEHFDLIMKTIQGNVEQNAQKIQEIKGRINKAIEIHLLIYEWVE